MFMNFFPPTIKKNFDSHSLANFFQDLIKVFPQNFEISTNNGKYRFNKYLVELLMPSIKEALNKNEDLVEYHFDIKDEQNIMQKIENLLKGGSDEFLNCEQDTIEQITSLFVNGFFGIRKASVEELNGSGTKVPGGMTIAVNIQPLYMFLSQSQRTFKIKTNQNEYLCNYFGVFASKAILSYLESHPNSTEYYFDFNEENRELEPIIDFFNWKILQFTPDTANSILSISENLGITSLIDSLNSYIQIVDENTELFNRNRSIIDPYYEIFEKLFNIKEIGSEKVAEFIENSEWAATKADVHELVACLLLVAKAKLSIISQLAELVQILSGKKECLSELAPFLVQRLISTFGSNSNLCAFLYHMMRLNFVSFEKIAKKIPTERNRDFESLLLPVSKSDKYQYQWLLPEIFYEKFLSNEDLIYLILDIQNIRKIEQEEDIFIEEAIADIRVLRENCGQKDPIIESIKNDDVDMLQSIVSHSTIDVHNEKIKMTVFDGIQKKKIRFIDYSAFCGSLKCFKYLFLEKVPISSKTLCYAIRGGNAEIIHILDQNKDSFTKPKMRNFGPKKEDQTITTAVQYHCNDIFDWLIDNSDDKPSFINIFQAAISAGNVHVISKVIENGFFISQIDIDNLRQIICSACENGLYRILLFISKLVSFSNLFDPSKIFNKKNILYYYTEIMNSSIIFGNVKIFDLLFENMKIKYSVVINKILTEAIKLGNIEIVKHILDNKIYELSDSFLVKAICSSIESDSDELIDYLIGQGKDFPLTTEIITSACASNNIKLVKSLIQMANDKGISIDFTQPFIKAISSKSEEITKLFVELKVDINYDSYFLNYHEIAKNFPSVILLLINEIKSEVKSKLIIRSFKAALSTNNIEILKFLMLNKYEYDDLLIKAVEISNLEVIKTILEINHSVEFINRIGKLGTALFQAVKNTSERAVLEKVVRKAAHYKDRKSQLNEIAQLNNQVIKYLLSQEGIDPSISVDSKNTPLVEAVKLNSIEAFNLIVDFYGDNIKDQGKQIHDALCIILNKSKNPPINKEQIIYNKLLILKNTANTFMQEDLLANAILENAPDIVEKLLNDESVNAGIRINNRDTYLHLAIDGNSVTTIHRLLLNHHSIDINASNIFKETPLV